MKLNHYIRISLVSLGVIFANIACISPLKAASFQGLGDLPSGRTCWSWPRAVSADASVVVGIYSNDSRSGVFYWTQLEGMVDLDMSSNNTPGDRFLTEAYGVSADGSVIVGFSESELGYEAFRWTKSKGIQGLGDFAVDKFNSRATDVSADGLVVVGSGHSKSGKEAFRWTESGGMQGLGDLPGGYFWSEARGVSADGTVVVGTGSSEQGFEAFYWTKSKGMVGLGDLPGGKFSSEAYGVSADGLVVVGLASSASGAEAFRWTKSGGMKGLGDLPEGRFCSWAHDVSADGSVVVGWSVSGKDKDGLIAEAFIWDAHHGMRNLKDVLVNDFGLDLAGWTLEKAIAISDDGFTIVGEGINPGDGIEGWIANISCESENAMESKETMEFREHVESKKPVNAYPFYEATIEDLPPLQDVQGILIMAYNHPAMPCYLLAIGNRNKIEKIIGFEIFHPEMKPTPLENDIVWIERLYNHYLEAEPYDVGCADPARVTFITKGKAYMVEVGDGDEFISWTGYRSYDLKKDFDELFKKHGIKD